MIREGTLNDAPTLAGLVTELGYPTSSGQMRRRLEGILADPGYRTLVWEEDGRVLGMIGLRKGLLYEGDEGFVRISALVVCSEARGSGVGRALVAEAERLARELGCSLVVVSSGVHREDAHSFYRELGYVEKGLSFFKEVGE